MSGARPGWRAHRGATLVALLVGAAVGLLVIAATVQALARQIAEERRLQLETQLQQDLRHAADLVVRELRRAGHWGGAAQTLTGTANPFDGLASGSATTFAVSRSAAEGTAPASADLAGFRLRNGVVEMLAGGAGWQALTDAAALQVTRFELTVRSQPQALPCAQACAAGDATCPPQLWQRQAELRLGARALHDARVQRELTTAVQLRNPVLTGRCPA